MIIAPAISTTERQQQTVNFQALLYRTYIAAVFISLTAVPSKNEKI
jgi:hypothetical protein